MGNLAQRRTILAIVVLVTASLMPALAVHGNTITYQMQIPLRPTDWNQLVTVPQYDPSTGMLNFVVVRLGANFQATILAENRAPIPGNITATLTTAVVLTPPSPLAPLSATASIAQNSQPVAAYDGVPWVGPDVAAWSLGPTQLNAQQTFTGANMNAFLGSGTLQFAVAGAAMSSVSSDTPSLAAQIVSRSGAQIQVEYDYTIIPEPATVVLLLIGLAALHRGRRS